MPAPTWPPDPRTAFEETARDYGVDPASIGDDTRRTGEDDEEAERSILSRFLLEEPESPLRLHASAHRAGMRLSETQRALEAWLQMLGGMDLDLAGSDPATTDGRRVFLPQALPPPREQGDEVLYRVMGLLQVGLLRHGLLPRALLGELYRDWVFRSTYHLLAVHDLMARWRHEYPGLAADFDALPLLGKAGLLRVNLTVVPREGMPRAFRPLYAPFLVGMEDDHVEGEPTRALLAAVQEGVLAQETPGARVLRLAGLARRLRLRFKQLHLGPPPLPYVVGILRPEWILGDLARDERAERAWEQDPGPLRRLLAQRPGIGEPRGVAPPPKPRRLLGRLLRGLERLGEAEDPTPPAEIPAYGLLRDEYHARSGKRGRSGSGPGESAPAWSPGMAPDLLLSAEASPPASPNIFLLDEWDADAGLFRPEAARLTERLLPAGRLSEHAQVREAHAGALREVRRAFASLQSERRWLHGQVDGSDLDLDRAVRALGDLRAGREPERAIHLRFQRERQPVAVLVVADTSGSVLGHRLELEKEALLLLAEGLSMLTHPWAMAAFHGLGPADCAWDWLKRFEDRFDEETLRRTVALTASGGSRLGAIVRHGSRLLLTSPTRRRVLLLLSDGVPEDRDGYRGRRGVEDTALAVFDARRRGVKVFCVGMDPFEGATDTREAIFGKPGSITLRDAEALPRRLPEIVRGLLGT